MPIVIWNVVLCTSTPSILSIGTTALAAHNRSIAKIVWYIYSQSQSAHPSGGDMMCCACLSLVPCTLNSSVQKWLINTLSRSEIIEPGKPCKRTTYWMNLATTVLAENGCLRAKKWPYLLKRSTTTKIVSQPSDLGNPSIKSIVMSSHIRAGTSNGWSSPAGDVAWVLCC